ncbi:MAG: UDP-2,3-diacylglucosamine diphosphatase LpxI [Proteobacteria bacterium]|nr:UDP-2,3-diacylglucosamine diphosphatase LpxI [Pseudomonadota bacterium]MBI3496891.1 UDP-2,3-diacylglucosamine diphosphatase LpxI [Pseudomonadota bacterium]
MQAKLGILAGGGPLPGQLIAVCKESGRPVFVLAFKGETDPSTVSGVEHAWIRVGAAGTGMELLREAGCEELVLAGPVKRLSPASLRPDWRTLQFFAKIGRRAWGDDGLLSAVINELEGEGFRVVGAEEILPSLLAPLGPLGRIAADPTQLADIGRGLEVLRELGRLDIGQAAIVQQGVVLGLEAIEGTDQLIERCGKLQRAGRGGVLVKVKKPGQETRVDLPTIGERTVRRAAESGLSGIAIEAGGTIVLGRDAAIAAADERGLFLEGVRVSR